MDPAAAAAAAQHEEALLEAGRARHHAITSALRARLTNYDVRATWLPWWSLHCTCTDGQVVLDHV